MPRPATRPRPMSRRPTTSDAWPSSPAARARTTRSRREGGGAFRFAGARLVPPLRGRWVVATVPTTVPGATSATGPTRSGTDDAAPDLADGERRGAGTALPVGPVGDGAGGRRRCALAGVLHVDEERLPVGCGCDAGDLAALRS